MHSQVQTVRQATHLTQARALAQAGVERALSELLLVPELQRWRPDGTVHRLRWQDGDIGVAVQDVSGLQDLSTAREELIHGLLAVEAPVRTQLRDAILGTSATQTACTGITALRMMPTMQPDSIIVARVKAGAASERPEVRAWRER